MNQDELLLARLEDKIDQAADRYMVTSGDFLDTHQRKVAEDYCKSRKLPVRVIFYGGYKDAERCIPVFLPDYADAAEEASELLKVVRVTAPKGSRALTHRDYLGSLLALGLDREVTGDILVRQADDKSGGGADIIVQAEIAEFIKLNYDKAGRTNLAVEILPIEQLDRGTINIVQKRDTVASLRLDNIVSSAYGLSRGKAAEAIRRGIVSVNSMEALKVDMEIREGDKIVMRGAGKAILAEVGGTSRKDRIRITFNIYK
ncbi:MAG: RNA-binding protein [Firmicutes bacterium]|nr:RNA-binding protein [Bacillota bacterium]